MWGRNVAKKVGVVLAAARSPPCGEMTAARAVTTAMNQTLLKKKAFPLVGKVSRRLSAEVPLNDGCLIAE